MAVEIQKLCEACCDRNKLVMIDKCLKPEEHRKQKRWIEFGAVETYSYIPAFGKSTAYAVCPFCHKNVLIYVWSFYGGGKKCPTCESLLTVQGAKRVIA